MAYTNIDDPSAYFQTALWTGNATNRTIDLDSNSTMQPDFSWVKSRSNTYEHYWQNSSTGTDKYLRSNSSAAQQNGTIVTYNSTGFGIGSGAENNVNGTTNVGWFWKVNGGTTTSKSSGTVAGNVTTPCVQQVNTDSGISILTYTASTSYAGTETHLEHGLGAGPRVLLVKRLNGTADWAVYHADNGGSPNAGYSYNVLNTTAATAQASPTNQYWLNTPAESNATLLAFGSNGSVGSNGDDFICFAFAEKQGYSKFSSYVGNGSTDGPFVYTGFKPAVIIHKSISTTKNWGIITGGTFKNEIDARLNPNLTGAEGTGTMVDFLSNGFKWRTTNGTANTNGITYIYIAFAENPFTTSTGIPTTAR